MKSYDNIVAINIQHSIHWQGTHTQNIRTSPTTQIGVDGEARLVTLADPAKGRTLLIPFDNIISIEQGKAAAPAPAPVPAKAEQHKLEIHRK